MRGSTASHDAPVGQSSAEGRPRILAYLTCEQDQALGSAYVALGFAERLAQLGYHVDIVDPSRYEPFRRIRRAVFYKRSLGLLQHALRSTFSRKHDILIFYGGEAWLAIAVLSLLPRRLRALLVIHSNGLEPHCSERMRQAVRDEQLPKRRWFQRDPSALTRIGFRRADCLVVVSEVEGKYARDRGWPRSGRLLVVENPLPPSYLGRPFGDDREAVVGFCGSWIARKGTARLRREIPQFLRRNRDWRFRMIGAGGAELVEEFPVDVRARIEAAPARGRTTGLEREYSRLAMLVSASIYESFGLTIAEAMACGCAVVATPVGFASGLKNREEVVLCDAGEPGVLSASLEEVARDSELRLRLVLGGWKRVQSLDWDAACSQLDRWLQDRLTQLRHE